jgi:uncharacterized membrane protein YdbT with pleckstrin-like domain
MNIDKNSLPKVFQGEIMQGEEILAATKKSNVVIIMGFLVKMIPIIAIIISVLLFEKIDFSTIIGKILVSVSAILFIIALIALHIIRNQIIILTNKRIIASIKPKLFTKDKISLPLKSIDNIQQDDTFFGNIFGWTAIKIISRSGETIQKQVSKESVKKIINEFYTLLDEKK